MIKTLLALRFQAFLHQITNRSKKAGAEQHKRKGGVLLYLILYLYVLVVFGVLFGSSLLSVASIAFPMGQDWLFFTMYVLLAFIMMFIGSIFTTKSQLFEAKDNEFLLSMPIRPRDIFMSRMASLLLINFVLELAIFVPGVIIYGTYGSSTVLSWCFFVLTFLALPFFSFAVSGAFAWLLSLLNAKFRSSAWVTTALYLVLFFGYYYLISNFEKYLEYFMVSGTDFMGIMARIAPLYWFGSAIANANPLHLLYSLLIYLVPFILAFSVLSHSFLKICTTKPTAKRAKEKGMGNARASTASKALLRREFKRLTSSQTYLLNCGFGILMMLLATGALAFKREQMLGILGLLPIRGDVLIGLGVVLLLCSISATCCFTAPSISLEGKCFSILRMLPVRTEEILFAKLKMHLLILLPTVGICSIVTLIVFPMSLPVALAVVLIPLLYNVWVANIGLIWGLRFPVLDWTNEAVAVKQGTAVLLAMLFASFPALLLGIGALALSFVTPWLSLALWIVATVAADVWSFRAIMRGGVARFEAILT